MYGFKHVDENVEHAKSIVDCLPSKSSVGLEVGRDHPAVLRLVEKRFPLYAAYLRGCKPGFFTRVAAHAKFKGHSVFWLMRPEAYVVGAAPFFNRVEALLCGHVERHGSFTVKPRELAGKLKLIEEAESQNVFKTAKWVSSVMLRRMRSKKWKPTDVAFTGRFHAYHLSQDAGLRPVYVPGHDARFLEFAGRLEQDGNAFERGRKIRKSLFKAKKMFSRLAKLFGGFKG